MNHTPGLALGQEPPVLQRLGQVVCGTLVPFIQQIRLRHGGGKSGATTQQRGHRGKAEPLAQRPKGRLTQQSSQPVEHMPKFMIARRHALWQITDHRFLKRSILIING